MHTLMDLDAIDATTIDQLRTRLCDERVAATAAIESSKLSMAVLLDERHDETADKRYSEWSARLGNARHHLDLVNAALGRMTKGTFGSCELCGIDIALARLEARPFAAHCLRCAQVVGV